MAELTASPLMFDRSKLVRLVVPLLIEHLLTTSVTFISSIMVASAGEAAVSGISLVNQVFAILNLVFMALAAGGSVVAAQYLGKGVREEACKSADQLMLSCLLVSVILTVGSFIFNRQILGIMFGSVDADVMECAVRYFYIVCLSFPFLATYNAAASLFRAMGNTKTAMIVSFVMNGVNIIGNAVFIYSLDMGITGVALALVLARIAAAVVMVVLIRNPKLPLYVTNFIKCGFNTAVIGKILKIGVPNALENSIFHLGKLLTLSLISTFGTASIAANSCASNIESISQTAGGAIGACLITIVGQCVGAEEYKQARMYTKRFLGFSYAFILLFNIITFIFADTISSWYDLTPDATARTALLVKCHCLAFITVWPPAWTTPNALRAAGDAKYTMIVSIASMWICRVGMAYIIGNYMHERYDLGLVGVAIATFLDWAVRGIFFTARIMGNKWENKSLVKD